MSRLSISFQLLICFFFACTNVVGQVDSSRLKNSHFRLDSVQNKISGKPDSLNLIKKNSDSVFHYSQHSLDSLQKNFHHRSDSIQLAYAAPMRKLDAEILSLNHKKDSLTKLNLPTASLSHRLDSLRAQQSLQQKELNTKIAQVKKETLGKVSALNLPPEAQQEVNSFTKNIQGFQVPAQFFKLPQMSTSLPGMPNIPKGSLPGLPSANLPSLSLPNANSSLPSTNVGNLKLPSTTQLEGVVNKDLQQIESVKQKANAEAIEKDVENVAQQNSELKSVTKEEQQLKGLKKELSNANPKNADSLAMQQLTPAVNHFAGKEKELQSAMAEVSKLKQKYSSVKSMAELPKRRPNPLKGKPWYERLIPGLNYFVMSRHTTLVDFNPYVSWRFSPKLTGSIGWNERMGISKGHIITHRYDRVFGVRSSLAYSWSHGIIFKIAPEVMDAFVPTGSPDVQQEKLVFSGYAGVRKDFPIYKSLSGYSEVLYNFTQKPGQNIYGDPVTFRFGVEVKLKKKVKK